MLPNLAVLNIHQKIRDDKEKAKLWPDQTNEKKDRVKAEGDYALSASALNKRYREVLMGRGPADGVARRENILDESVFNHDQESNLNENQIKQANNMRETRMQKAKQEAKTAMKMDGIADRDLEGYRNVIDESQSFRASLPNRKEIRLPLVPLSTKINHTALKRTSAVSGPEQRADAPDVKVKVEKERSNAPIVPNVTNFSKSARGSDLTHDILSKRDDLTLEIGRLFLRIIGADITSASQHSATSEEARRIGQVLIVREMSKINEPTADQLKNIKKVNVEESLRSDVQLIARHLGNAFVDIGLTLPSGRTVEDARRNDIVAKQIGARAIENSGFFNASTISKTYTVKRDSARTELLATAIGRILMHLRGASHVMNAKMEAPLKDQTDAMKDRSMLALGRLTLQMIEQSALSTKSSQPFESRKHSDDFLMKLGRAVFAGASELSTQVQRPSQEETLKTSSQLLHDLKHVTAQNQNGKSMVEKVEEARRPDSFKNKEAFQLHVDAPNEPIPLQKHSVYEQVPQKVYAKVPGIETLPSQNRLKHLTKQHKSETQIRERNAFIPIRTLEERPLLTHHQKDEVQSEEPQKTKDIWKQKVRR